MEIPNFSKISEERKVLRRELRDSGINAPDALAHPALQSDPSVQRLQQLNTEAAAFHPQNLTEGRALFGSPSTPGTQNPVEFSLADTERTRVADLLQTQAQIEERVVRAQYLLFRNPNNPNLAQQVQRGERLRNHAAAKRKSLESNPDTALLVRDATLSEYQNSLDQGNFVVTPSRQEYIQKIQAAIERGEPVLLEGHTGTGKSEVARIAALQLTGQSPEVVSCKPSTRPSDIWGKQGLRAEAGVAVTKIDYGPLTRAMQSGTLCVFDEFNEMDPRERQQLKWLYNVKPGQEVDIPGNGKVVVQQGFGLVMTANLKSDKYQAKQSLEPQEARVFATSAYTVDSMPASELYDVALATLRGRDGSLPISESEATTTLKHLCDAVGEIQRAYSGQVGAHYQAQMATGRKAGLKDYTLDTGLVVRMLQGYSHEQLRDPKLPLQKYLDQKLIQTLAPNLYTESDKKFAAFLLASKGFLGTIPNPALEIRVEYAAGEALNPQLWPKPAGTTDTNSGPLTRAQVNTLDPYHQRVTATGDVLADFGVEAPGAGDTSQERRGMSLAECERILGPDFLGPEAYQATFGEAPTDIPPLHLTPEELQNIKDRGEQLVLMQSEFHDGTPLTMKEVHTRKPKQADGISKLLEDTSWYSSEAFFTTDTPKTEWRIVSQTPVGLGHNYLQQTEDLIGHIQTLYPQSVSMPQAYQDAILEYGRQQAAIVAETDWQKKSQTLANLQINQLLRSSATETLLHISLYNSGTKSVANNLLHTKYSWTNSRTSDGRLVRVGSVVSDGADVRRGEPGRVGSLLGVLPSRSVGL